MIKIPGFNDGINQLNGYIQVLQNTIKEGNPTQQKIQEMTSIFNELHQANKGLTLPANVGLMPLIEEVTDLLKRLQEISKTTLSSAVVKRQPEKKPTWNEGLKIALQKVFQEKKVTKESWEKRKAVFSAMAFVEALHLVSKGEIDKTTFPEKYKKALNFLQQGFLFESEEEKELLFFCMECKELTEGRWLTQERINYAQQLIQVGEEISLDPSHVIEVEKKKDEPHWFSINNGEVKDEQLSKFFEGCPLEEEIEEKLVDLLFANRPTESYSILGIKVGHLFVISEQDVPKCWQKMVKPLLEVYPFVMEMPKGQKEVVLAALECKSGWSKESYPHLEAIVKAIQVAREEVLALQSNL